jgi:hypothetical protein
VGGVDPFVVAAARVAVLAMDAVCIDREETETAPVARPTPPRPINPIDHGPAGDRAGGAPAARGAGWRSRTGNRAYWIRPASAASAFQAFCDMTADTGGWTLVANYPLGLQITPPGWSTTGVEGTVFHAENTVFKLADATINALKTTAFRVRARAPICVTGACALDHTL